MHNDVLHLSTPYPHLPIYPAVKCSKIDIYPFDVMMATKYANILKVTE